MGQGVRLALGGAAAGLIAAMLVRRVVASLLYGVSPGDPITIGLSLAILVLTAGLASGIPALRAMAFSPAKVLREE